MSKRRCLLIVFQNDDHINIFFKVGNVYGILHIFQKFTFLQFSMETIWKSPEDYSFDQDMYEFFQHLYRTRHHQFQTDLNHIQLKDSRIHVIFDLNINAKKEAVELQKRCEAMVRVFQRYFAKDTDLHVDETELPKAREVIQSFQAEIDNVILVLEKSELDVTVLIIMAMNQDVIQSCKHKLRVGLKRITVGMPRARRHIVSDGSEQNFVAQGIMPDNKEAQDPVVDETLMTYEDMKVCVCKKDIVEWDDPKACIVNPINVNFEPTGGVSKALMKIGGEEFKECMKTLSKGEKRKPGDCVTTEAFRLKVPTMLNVICPSRKLTTDVLNEQRCNRNIFNSVYNCMRKAEEAKLDTVIFPFLFTGKMTSSSAIFGKKKTSRYCGNTDVCVFVLQAR